MKRLAPKILSCLIVFCFFAISLTQAQESHELVSVLVKHWQASKALTLEVAKAMPAEDYGFKATPAEMSFGEQMNHIAKANANYCSSALSTSSPFKGSTDTSKDAATKNLTSVYDFCIDGLQKLSDADLMKTVGTAPHTSTVFERFWGGFTHAAHHRGQAEVYLRLKGITPPDYTF